MKSHSQQKLDEAKQELNSLHRSIATLHANRGVLRKQIDAELALLRKKAHEELKEELQPLEVKRDTLKNEVTSLLSDKKATQLAVQEAKDVQETDLTTAMQEKRVLELSVAALTNEKRDLESKTAFLRETLTTLGAEIETKGERVRELDGYIREHTEHDTELTQTISRKSADLEALEKSTAEREAESARKVANLEAKATNLSEQITHEQDELDAARRELANRKIELDKRESVIADREIRVKMQEDRVYNYTQVMKL